jgi:hypothetical protein
MRKGERTISRRITKKNNRLWRYYKEEWQEKPLLFPKNLLLLSQNSLIFLANSPQFGNKRRQPFLSTGKETKLRF